MIIMIAMDLIVIVTMIDKKNVYTAIGYMVKYIS